MSAELLVTCRIEDRDEKYSKPRKMYTHKKIDGWIDEKAAGNRQIVYNFLLAKGIEAVEKEGTLVAIKDIDDWVLKLVGE